MTKKRGKAAKAPEVLPSQTEGGAVEDLINEFRTRGVDESLIVLFHAEYGFAEAHKTLSSIAANVAQEETSGFDPSGLLNDMVLSSPGIVDSSDAGSSSRMGSGDGCHRVSSRVTANTSDLDSEPFSPSASVSGRSFDRRCSIANDSPVNSSGRVGKLREMFPLLKDIDFKDAIKNYGDDDESIYDYLLNINHLEETSQRPKGVDGFFADDDGKLALFAPKKRGKKSKQKPPKTDQVPINYKLKPVELGDEDDIGTSAGTSKQQVPRSALALGSEDLRQNLAAAVEHHRARGSQSHDAARDLYRRGNSDPLFRQAAVVYTERSQEHYRVARLHESRRSDSIVDKQSSANTIDLHNVSVEDGVRNALERTQTWWSSLGENSIRKARENPLRVVTGIGRHSAGGYSPMYGQVGRALKSAGWKVEDGSGHYNVTGKKI